MCVWEHHEQNKRVNLNSLGEFGENPTNNI